METKTVSVRGGAFQTELIEAGSGTPLLFLHGWQGLTFDPLLEGLSASHRVIAPKLPGYGESTGDEHLVDFFDLIYYHLDLLDALGLREVPVVAHSLGAMIAAELAAVQPERISKLVLIAPFGLWNEEHPVIDFFVERPEALAAAMYADPSSEIAKAAATVPEDDAGRVAFFLERAKSLRIAAKYLWPIPNRGLAKRAHRISAPTLLIWGEKDGICPPALAEDFKAVIRDARAEIIPGAGHLPGAEQPAKTLAVVEKFLA
jgi:pimeloyl-ACP methyl ester carboxylesterase